MRVATTPSVAAEARINARLDAQAAAQLDYLTATTGLGVSEVVRASLAHYYRAQRAGQSPSLPHLTPLIGRYRSGHRDTSANVKRVVSDYLEAKRQVTSTAPGKPRVAKSARL